MDMGLGKLGGDTLIFKRKFRWTINIQTCQSGSAGAIPEYYLKSSARPEISIDETQIDYLNGRMWIPGKATWAELPVTFLDVAAPDFMPLFGWLSSVYQFDDSRALQMNTMPKDYQGSAIIRLYDGCGGILETWTLKNCWPKSYKFGDLAYENAEVCTIEVSLRYYNVEYEPGCGQSFQRCDCNSCAQ